jgi:hypothetical protein
MAFLLSSLVCGGLSCAATPSQAPSPSALVPDSHKQTVRIEKNARMLSIVVKGDPDQNGDSAMKVLLRHFFAGGGEPEMNEPIQPRIRWKLRAPSVPRKSWVAIYGLPVSESFPSPMSGGAIIETWGYGLVAESSYSGPYGNAQPAIDSLQEYVSGNGFAPFGALEEVYIRGRGTLDQGNPAGYLTLVRYRVKEPGAYAPSALPLSSNP